MSIKNIERDGRSERGKMFEGGACVHKRTSGEGRPMSKIEWTDETWNPVTGCTKVSPGCDNCYAEAFAERWRGIPGHPYEQGFDLKLWPERLGIPRKWRKSRRVFVNSMSDMFHEDVPDWFIQQVFFTMSQTPRHTYQVLTKRAPRMKKFMDRSFQARFDILCRTKNVWLGVSVESDQQKGRIKHLRETPAPLRFVSFEPLIAPVGTVDLSGIHWAIIGGESGPGARPMRASWAREIVHRCREQGVKVFMKQLGSHGRKGRGGELEDLPKDLRIREFPD